MRIYNPDIGMEFGIKKWAIQIMNCAKRQMTERIELSNREKNQKAQRKGNLEILWNIGRGHHQISEDEIKW